MTKIAVIGTRGMPGIQGGVEQHCEHLYPKITDKDTFIRIYRRRSYLNPNSNINYPNIEYVDLPSTRIKGFEAIFHTLLCCLHLTFYRVDVVHVHNIGPALCTPLLKLFGYPVVLTFHSANYEHNKWGRIAKLILKFSEWISLRFSDKIIFVNKFQIEKYSSRIQAKSVYIPNGVDPKGRSDKQTFLNKFGIQPNMYLLGVGRITPEKGFDILIEAVNKIDDIKQLVIAGSSDHDIEYLGKLKDLDINHKVIFTGFTSGEDLCQLYSFAKLFVLSSRNEGFPLVLLEAMNYNLPVLVSDISATHLVKLADDDYVEANNVEALITGIKNKISSPVISRHYDLSNYSWNKVAVMTKKIFLELQRK